MLQWIWSAMIGGALLYACVNGNGHEMMEAALAGTADAIALTMRLGAGYMLFCGLMEIVRGIGLEKRVASMLRPLFRALMPSVQKDETAGAITMNLSMNLLGLGNAATPVGMEAMRLMEMEERQRPAVRKDMFMLLILNATSIQLLPATVLTLRSAAGSADPHAILLPTLLCTTASTGVGVLLAICLRRIGGRKHG